MNRDLWLFGYGSIMWKTGFEYAESRLAFVQHRARRFWQASKDHRGTEEAPGRVVTLVDAPGEDCWGLAYRIPEESISATLEILDYREKGGYDREAIEVRFPEGDFARGLTYNAGKQNPNYLGDAPIASIAHQIASSHGPSGSNKEYILQLADTLVQHDIVDHHIVELAEQVRNIQGQEQ